MVFTKETFNSLIKKSRAFLLSDVVNNTNQERRRNAIINKINVIFEMETNSIYDRRIEDIIATNFIAISPFVIFSKLILEDKDLENIFYLLFKINYDFLSKKINFKEVEKFFDDEKTKIGKFDIRIGVNFIIIKHKSSFGITWNFLKNWDSITLKIGIISNPHFDKELKYVTSTEVLTFMKEWVDYLNNPTFKKEIQNEIKRVLEKFS